MLPVFTKATLPSEGKNYQDPRLEADTGLGHEMRATNSRVLMLLLLLVSDCEADDDADEDDDDVGFLLKLIREECADMMVAGHIGKITIPLVKLIFWCC